VSYEIEDNGWTDDGQRTGRHMNYRKA